MTNYLPKTIALLFATLVLASGQAKAASNFSGEWKLNTAKSDFGGIPAPQVLTRSIRHHDPVLEISTHNKGAKGETTTQLKYTTDGKECINKLPSGDAKGTARWQGGSLIVESSLEFQGGVSKQKENWTLSNDGKTLTILNHVSGQREFDVKYVFEKE